MKSKNHLVLTGSVSSVIAQRGGTTVSFILAHNFGGLRMPMFLKCIMKPNLEAPRKGDMVCITASLEACGKKYIAYVKSIRIERKKGLVVVQRETEDELFIPAEQCVIDLFKVSGRSLIFPTGFVMLFDSHNDAENARCSIVGNLQKDPSLAQNGIIWI